MQNKIGRNVGANIVGKLWNIISIYIFVPLWVKILGIEGYGVVTFYSVLLTILVFADAGLTATLTREFAKMDVPLSYKQNLLKTIELVYFFLCVFVFGAVFGGAEWIVGLFLKAETISHNELIYSVRLMGAIIAVYLLYSLYQGGLMGLQEQICGNTLNILYGIMRSGIVLIPLIFYPNILVFLYWQLFSIVVFCLLTRYKIYQFVRTGKSPSLRFNYLRLVGGYAAGMMILTIMASLNTQLDKLLVGHLLKLSDFSKYSLASTVGQITLMVTLPLGLAFYPELTRLISLGKKRELKSLFHKFSYIVAALSSSISFIVVVFCSDFIYIWTHDLLISHAIARAARILVIANFFVALQYGPYFLALAYGYTKTNIVLGGITVITLVVLLFKLTPIYGIDGAAIPFLVINVIIFFVLGIFIIRKFLISEFKIWLFYDSLFPCFINLGVVTLLFVFIKNLPQGYFTLLYGFIAFFFTMLCCGLIFLKRFPEYQNNRIIKIIVKWFYFR